MSQSRKRPIKRTLYLSQEEDQLIRKVADDLGWSINAVICQMCRRADQLQIQISPHRTPTPYDL